MSRMLFGMAVAGLALLAIRAAESPSAERLHDLEMANSELLAERQVLLDSIGSLQRELRERVCLERPGLRRR
jgi:hypothetical protein